MSRTKKLDDLMEAIAFAEVGELDTAQGIASEVFREHAPPHEERILAVSRAAGFSPTMIDHSLGMAERMGYGLIALSVRPAMARLVGRLRGRVEKGRLPAEVFRARATERGVPFLHAVGQGDPEKAVVAVTRRFRRIAFLLVEPELAARARFSGVPVPVFTVEEA